MDPLALLAGVGRQDLLESLPHREGLARVDLYVRGLALERAGGLVNQNAAVGEDGALVGCAAGQNDRAHGHRNPAADRLHVWLDELHRVVDRQPGVHLTAWAVDVEGDVLVGIVGLEM